MSDDTIPYPGVAALNALLDRMGARIKTAQGGMVLVTMPAEDPSVCVVQGFHENFESLWEYLSTPLPHRDPTVDILRVFDLTIVRMAHGQWQICEFVQEGDDDPGALRALMETASFDAIRVAARYFLSLHSRADKSIEEVRVIARTALETDLPETVH